MPRPGSKIMQTPAQNKATRADLKAALTAAKKPVQDAAAAARDAAFVLKRAQQAHAASLKALSRAQATYNRIKVKTDRELAQLAPAASAA